MKKPLLVKRAIGLILVLFAAVLIFDAAYYQWCGDRLNAELSAPHGVPFDLYQLRDENYAKVMPYAAAGATVMVVGIGVLATSRKRPTLTTLAAVPILALAALTVQPLEFVLLYLVSI